MEAVVLHGLRFLDYFCPKQGQDFKPSAAPIYPNMGKVPPSGNTGTESPKNQFVWLSIAIRVS